MHDIFAQPKRCRLHITYIIYVSGNTEEYFPVVMSLTRINRCSTALFIILSPPRFLLEIRVIIKISKKFLVSHKLWLIWIRMKQKKFFFFWKKKFKMADSKKLSFSATPKSWAIVAKISQIGPWVSRIDWCEGHQCDSTYMAVRLSNVSPK